mmetsp:Transcript_3412/g.9778  ORF Transcript_3412/g.9778 Transcript_3412/m.9778 type:complete len:139 (-) Transcript_3412:525-941(-)
MRHGGVTERAGTFRGAFGFAFKSGLFAPASLDPFTVTLAPDACTPVGCQSFADIFRAGPGPFVVLSDSEVTLGIAFLAKDFSPDLITSGLDWAVGLTFACGLALSVADLSCQTFSLDPVAVDQDAARAEGAFAWPIAP